MTVNINIPDSTEKLNYAAKTLQDRLNGLSEHVLTPVELQDWLKTDIAAGITTSEVETRLVELGYNELSGDSAVVWYKLLFAQVVNPMNLILLVALALSAYHKEWIDCAVIGFVVFTNSLIGFVQEYRSEKTMEALMKMASPIARVLRDTTIKYIAARDAVPGDILMIEEGDIVPADGRLVECFHLEVDEQMLTGESVPVVKDIASVDSPETAVADRINMVYSSTVVTRGRGKVIVTRTGLNTEIGKIADRLNSKKGGSVEQKTPLQKAMQQLAIGCLIAVIFLILIVFGVNRFNLTSSIVSYAIGLAVAVIPAGLPAVTTITMAYGVRKMANQKAIVRKMLALENIGSVTTICSDKTGTLTQGKMFLQSVYTPDGGNYVVSGNGYKPSGSITHVSDSSTAYHRENMPKSLYRLTQCASLCNLSVLKRVGKTEQELEQKYASNAGDDNGIQMTHASPIEDSEENEWEVIGDSTEAALQVYAWKANMAKRALVSDESRREPLSFELLQEYPFDATIKRMSVIYQDRVNSSEYFVFSKGSMESILALCVSYLKDDDSTAPVNAQFKAQIEENVERLASEGLRVLALAFKPVASTNIDEIEQLSRESVESELIFLGLVGIFDPPREETRDVIQLCHQAGISVHMLTGDHKITACNIAQRIGILPPAYSSNAVMTGAEFDALSEEKRRTMMLPLVIARCTPSTKVNMVDALQYRKQIVAMTGDGTNDAPSLKQANIGVAMGMNGSDVAKQASDIVLTDDNFASIVKAIAEGRRIFASIQKFVQFLMSTNVAEIIALVIGLAYQDSTGQSVFPMSAVQILILNMLTSTPPAVGLGVERASSDQMRVPPRDATKRGSGVFSVEVIVDTFVYGIIMGSLTLGVWSAALYGQFQPDPDNGITSPLGSGGCNDSQNSMICQNVFRARGASYCAMSLLILVHAINCRHLRLSMFKSKTFGIQTLLRNKALFWSILFGAAVTAISLYIPGLNDGAFLQLPISWEWGLIIASMALFLAFAEAYKAWKRHLAPQWFFADEMNPYAQTFTIPNDAPVISIIQ
ncbi:hypothetical protein MP228_001305 [Amoeboaphelidium protococcarum]|nr:hypothetical protein MP228_001305 [Amoeboaphelidium protococcarum]